MKQSAKRTMSSHQSLKKQPEVVDNRSPWEKDLQNFDVEDPEFNCYVTFFIESTPTYYGLMEIFNEEALNGKRWEIKVVSMAYIKKRVLDHCTKSREKKPFNLLCDQILRYAGYEFKRRIPTNLLGYFIKYEIRRLKTMYKEYKDYQKEYEDGKEDKLKAITVLDSNIDQVTTHGKVSSNDYKGSIKSGGFPLKSTSKSGTPSKILQQYGKRRSESELTKRDEDKRGKFYVKDYPIHGPEVYLVITTIYEQLPTELIEVIGIPVVGIIKVGHDQIDCLEEDPNKEIIFNHLMELNQFYYKSNCYRKKFNLENEQANKTNEVETFWLNFNRKIQKPESSNNYGKTILGRYLPPIDKVNYDSPNWKDKLQAEIYDDITQTLYNLYEIKELYNQYNNSIGVVNIKIPEASFDFDMNIYNEILDKIPTKYINVPTILSSMISQIEESMNDLDSESSIRSRETSEITSKRGSIKEELLRNILTQLNDEYDIYKDIKDENEKRKKLNDFLPKNITIKCPHSVTYRKYLEENKDILKTINLTHFEENTIENSQTYKNHLNALQKALGTRQNKVLSELFIVLKTIENNDSKVMNTARVNSAEEEISSSNSQIWKEISKYNTMEELDSNVLVNILLDLNLSHNTCKSIYIPLLDSILFIFYNCPKNNSRTIALQTPLGFKDFFKYVLPKKKEWAKNVLNSIKNQCDPKLYQTNIGLLSNSQREQILTPVEITPKLKIDEKTFVFGTETDKYNENQEIVNYLNEIDFPDKFLSMSKQESLGIVEDIVIGKDNSKKGESSDATQSLNENENHGIYDLGQNQRVQFVSKDVEALFRYDTKLRIKYRHKHYGRKTMTLELEVCGHRLYYSSNVHINDEKSKFLFLHRSGISFSFIEWKHHWSTQEAKIGKSKGFRQTMDTMFKLGQSVCQPITPIPKKLLMSTYSLTIKTPLDYIIEINYLDEGEAFIKHSYLKPLSTKQLKNEYQRIYLRKNCIIKFLEENNIELLYSSGKKIVAKWSDYNYEHIENLQKIQEYTIYHGCGNVSIFSEGKQIKESKVQIEETNFTFDHYLIEHENGTTITFYKDGTQIVEFNDGTKFTTLAWTDTSLYDLNDGSKACINETEKFVMVYMKITVEHNNYATIIYNEENNTTEIKISSDITLLLYSDNTYNIRMSGSSSLSVRNDGIQLDKYLNNSLFQRSIIIPNILKYNYIPHPPLAHFFTKDIYGNELIIDTQSQIHYEYSMSKENAFCLKYVVNNTRHILLRRDLSGFELHPQFRFPTLLDKYNKNNDLMIEENWNAPFIKTTILFPIQKELINGGVCKEKQLRILPSTYGTTYFFPFLIKENRSKKPLTFARQLIKTLVSSDINEKYNEVVAKSQNIINKQITISKCKCLKKVKPSVKKDITSKKQCKNQNTVIKIPGPDFLTYLKEYILYNGLKRANFKITRPEELKKFRNKRREVLEKKIPPYFESAFGISYFISQQIKDNLNHNIEVIEKSENFSQGS